MNSKRSTLNSRLRVLTSRLDGVRSVSVCVLVGAGAVQEAIGQSGYAHFLEHMLFQGTGERDAASIAEMIQIGGGAIGAFTTRDYAVYHATILDDYLPFAMDVLGDMLTNSTLPQDAIEQQQRVITNEIAGRDDPLQRANDMVRSLLWAEHPLGQPIAGYKSSITAITRGALQNFMDQLYVAPNMVLAAAGNVKHEHFEELVYDSFYAVRQQDAKVAALQPPTIQAGLIHAEHREDIEQVYFTLAWPAPSYASTERYAGHVFASRLGGGPTSRLYTNLREQQGLAYYLRAEYLAYKQAGTYFVEGATNPDALVKLLAGVMLSRWS